MPALQKAASRGKDVQSYVHLVTEPMHDVLTQKLFDSVVLIGITGLCSSSLQAEWGWWRKQLLCGFPQGTSVCPDSVSFSGAFWFDCKLLWTTEHLEKEEEEEREEKEKDEYEKGNGSTKSCTVSE